MTFNEINKNELIVKQCTRSGTQSLLILSYYKKKISSQMIQLLHILISKRENYNYIHIIESET